MNVRHVLRELHRLGVADSAIGIQDETGDRYGRAEWVKDLPVARIVIIPATDVTTGPVRSALGIDAADPELDDPTDGEIRPYVGEFS